MMISAKELNEEEARTDQLREQQERAAKNQDWKLDLQRHGTVKKIRSALSGS